MFSTLLSMNGESLQNPQWISITTDLSAFFLGHLSEFVLNIWTYLCETGRPKDARFLYRIVVMDRAQFSMGRGILSRATEFALFCGIFIEFRKIWEMNSVWYNHWLDDINITNYELIIWQKKNQTELREMVCPSNCYCNISQYSTINTVLIDRLHF